MTIGGVQGHTEPPTHPHHEHHHHSNEAGVSLSAEQVSKGLRTLGVHPLALRHSFLELFLSGLFLKDISAVAQFPLVMYLDISNNRVESLSTLAQLTSLVTLNARGNQLSDCLDFVPPLCNEQKAWSEGKQAVGSMLTLADLRDNEIFNLDDLSAHRFIECLLLANNKIKVIKGLSNLKYLQTLDLSSNRLTRIEGLAGLPIRELKLSHNEIEELHGLDQLPCLSALEISHNKIRSLKPLQNCPHLSYLDVRYNHIEQIRQVEFLLEIQWLHVLCMEGNPCYKKDHYRLRVLYRLPNLKRLDQIIVSPEEKIKAFNLYHSGEGDLDVRKTVHQQYLPDVPFEDHSPEQLAHDEESELTSEELNMGKLLSRNNMSQ